MTKKPKTILIIIIVIIAISVVGYLIVSAPDKPKENLDVFAQCLTTSGAKFYGTFWCSHCKNQKDMFGSSLQYAPYVECSNEDATAQLQVCTDAGIEAYPTWIFGDGTKQLGEISLAQLAQKTGCQLP